MFNSPEYQAMINVAKTYVENLNRDRKRLDFAYKLDKKKEKQGVGSEAGMNDSDERYVNKALDMERGRRGDLEKGMTAKPKRPRTRMPKQDRKGTIKKK